MTIVTVCAPFQAALNGTVYGPGEVVEAPDEMAARIQREASTGCYASTSPSAPNLSVHSAEYLAEVAAELNSRPRKRCDFDSPAQVPLTCGNAAVANQLLSQPPQVTVASEP